jgi:hypothetical protein
MTIQYDNLNSTISAVGTATNIPVNIQTKGTGGLNLLGSGQNLILQSQNFTVSWGTNAASATANATTAPDGTNTAGKLIESAATNFHYISQTITVPSGAIFTCSCYFKAAERTFANLQLGGVGFSNFGISVNLTDGTYITYGSVTGSSVIAVGNGWYRCSVSGLSTNPSGAPLLMVSNASTGTPNYLGDGTSGVFIWGAQGETGSVTNTYVPTTTTTIYGTPTLTLSGVAGLGLQSDGALYVQPAGTAALQAQPTTSTTVGGNARGQYAVDWQTVRGSAIQVASSYACFVGGGSSNRASGFVATVAAGVANNSTGAYAAILGGSENNATSTYATVSGGFRNNATGLYNFIGAGYGNTGTANAAVTTQATTAVTNGSTAVTLSGSNAAIRVGQFISGTGIPTYPNDTYVAAISGTSLTLSQAASATGTPVLSFLTPHGVVVGGGNNQATGSYSFIGSGGDAGTAANRNVASGDWSFVGGGRKNTASGIGSVVAGGGTDGANIFANLASASLSTISGGWNNTASAGFTTIAGGQSNISSGSLATIGGGTNNLANSSCSTVVGGAYGTARAITGNIVFSANLTPISSLIYGASQAALLILAVQTTDATATALRSDTGAAGTTNQVILPNNSAYFFRGEVISGVTGGGDTKGWTIEGVIKRGANAAATTLVGTPTVTSSFADAGASTWTIAVTADTTNGGLRVTFTGQASTTIRTVAQIRTTEMTY